MKKMKNKNIRYNLIILSLSFILGILVTITFKNRELIKLSFFPRDPKEVKQELDAVNTEIEKINIVLKDREKKIEILSRTSTEEAKDLLIEETKLFKNLWGSVDVKGEGVIITMEDALGNDNIDEEINVIHDADVLRIINDLKIAGAEAISVNGQRLVSTSEIKCGGPIIKVNNKSLATPFIIKAIGNVDTLSASINAPNTYASGLRNIDGINIETKAAKLLEIEGYKGNFVYRYAYPTGEVE